MPSNIFKNPQGQNYDKRSNNYMLSALRAGHDIACPQVSDVHGRLALPRWSRRAYFLRGVLSRLYFSCFCARRAGSSDDFAPGTYVTIR
jgi:hypothetical protein